eukprot:scpid28051/ scgid35741/ 
MKWSFSSSGTTATAAGCERLKRVLEPIDVDLNCRRPTICVGCRSTLCDDQGDRSCWRCQCSGHGCVVRLLCASAPESRAANSLVCVCVVDGANNFDSSGTIFIIDDRVEQCSSRVGSSRVSCLPISHRPCMALQMQCMRLTLICVHS